MILVEEDFIKAANGKTISGCYIGGSFARETIRGESKEMPGFISIFFTDGTSLDIYSSKDAGGDIYLEIRGD